MRLLILTVGALVGVTMASESAIAQPTEEITVSAPRIVQRNVGRGPTGIPIREVSISYELTYADLDLTKTAGVSELDRRIHIMAKQACNALDNLNPLSAKDPDCVRNAINSAADQRKHAIAAAVAK
jgi:UrcA family protein